MKEYRLSSWPDLPAQFQHTRYQRALHDMSQRFVSLEQLRATSSLRRGETRAFVRMLAAQQLLHERLRPGWFGGVVDRLGALLRRRPR